MTERLGRYADGRTFELPSGWDVLAEETRDVALCQAKRALGIGDSSRALVVDRVREYYNTTGGYSGSLFLSVEPNDDFYIGAADLWAVSTLSMDVPPLTGRKLLAPGAIRTNVTRQLRQLPPALPITDLNADTLDSMWNLYDCLRTVMSTDTKDSLWWVFASKMCARKRPLLFPVRDRLVCSFLSGGKRLGTGPGRLGSFGHDIQVFAHLMTSREIREGLSDLRQGFVGTQLEAELDWSDMRLLDIALWTAARAGVDEITQMRA